MLNISIIVPIAPQEKAWVNLWQDLKDLPYEIEIIFSGPVKPGKLPLRIKWVDSELSRAKQLNSGAYKSTNNILWFLHADSKFDKNTYKALIDSLNTSVDNLYYFELKFLPDGPKLMFLNEFGAKIRSHFLGIPFGDQGFCISKENFDKTGKFPIGLPYGEDHVFVWKAHKNKIKVLSIGANLFTSARKYQLNGWFHTTFSHIILWIKQVFSILTI